MTEDVLSLRANVDPGARARGMITDAQARSWWEDLEALANRTGGFFASMCGMFFAGTVS